MKKILLVISFLFTLHSISFASNNDKSPEVREFVANIGNSIIAASKDETINGQEKTNQIIKIVDNSIDSRWISRFVLGVNYRKANTSQRDKFRTLYRQYMINTYGPKFKNYKGDSFNVKTVAKQKRFYLVTTDFITSKTDPAISIDFRVKDYKGKLVILDFIAEGISLIETQRSEFNSAISKNGLDSFLDDLEERVRILKETKS